MRLFSLLFGIWIYQPYSYAITMILRIKGIKVGKRFYIQGFPYLKIRGNPNNIQIGNDVKIYGDIDLRIRENGQIIIEDEVSFDTSCRLVSANNSILTIRKYADIGCYNIFNAGASITIGENTLVASFCNIQSSGHGLSRSSKIKTQPHFYGAINIGNDVWIGSRVSVLPGVTISDGAVIGANAVVTKNLSSYTINIGIPAKKINERVFS